MIGYNLSFFGPSMAKLCAFMPIYEYQCRYCEHQLESLQKMSDAPLIECPACSKPELTKLISAACFRLSGGGWYETDFKTGTNKKNLTENFDMAKTSNGKNSA